MTNGNRQNGKERADGTGLGLYLIHKVIQKLGREIWYEAKENGSNFVFTLAPKSPSLLDTSLSMGAQLQMVPVNSLRP
jgi:signal transduction histidine kinase